jgi:hypothetical protein
MIFKTNLVTAMGHAIGQTLKRVRGFFSSPAAGEDHDQQARQLAAYQALVARYTMQIDKVTISGLPCYESHGREVVLVDEHNLHHAVHELLKQRYLGFDTESRPTFRKGEASHGISIIQICSATICYIFQMNKISDTTLLARLVDHPKIIKIGVGLRGDHSQLKSNFHFHPAAFVDLAPVFKPLGRKNDAGSKQLVALVLKQRLRKSKSASTSNWAVAKLSPMQIQYASDDAFSSIDVYLRLREELQPYGRLLNREIATLLDLPTTISQD